ncbi:hypothetical protein UM760_10155 [Staphylococcus aureus]|nr:hypothetical protein UM760_10155 [Staphylococcus aureus]
MIIISYQLFLFEDKDQMFYATLRV